MVFNGTQAIEVPLAATIAAFAAFHIEIADRRGRDGHLYAIGLVLITLGLYLSPIWAQTTDFTQTAFHLDTATNTRFWYWASSTFLLVGLGALYLVRRRA